MRSSGSAIPIGAVIAAALLTRLAAFIDTTAKLAMGTDGRLSQRLP